MSKEHMIKKKPEQATEIRKNMRAGAGEVAITHYFNKDEFSARCRLCAQLTLAPGSGIGPHQHADEDEVFIIQRGKGELIDDGTKIEVEAGDAILTGKGATHSITNTGSVDLVITAVIMQY